MGGRRRTFEPQAEHLAPATLAELVSGGEAIAACFGHTERWLRALMEKYPDLPVKRFPDDGLIAVREDLVSFVRRLPNASRKRAA